ncbi:MAG: hypothetical protein FWE23_10785 [Chitinivibrionia bacterium]|nr:hypothetical protein [Chitinivibrionia bacterium]
MVETHFKFFKWQPSFLYKDEPEIIFDCPARISPEKTEIPIYLFIKDFDKFPISLENVEIQVVCKGKMLATHKFDEISKHKIHEKYDLQGFRFTIPKATVASLPQILDEKLFLYPKLKYKIGEKTKIAAVDNINTTSNFPFSVYLASENYPNDDTNPAKYYDLHCHSSHTNDHIEFGAPVSFIADCADYTGLNGVAITDHSYDLSCKPENYLEKDEKLTHWQYLREECGGNDRLSHRIDVHLGEEISVVRNGGKAVHLGAIFDVGAGLKPAPTFVAGTADGARKGYNRKSEPTMDEAINSVIENGGVAFAAHPGEIPNFFHRLFLRRDHWRFQDFADLCRGVLHTPKSPFAFQATNGKFDKTWRRARNLWINLLLSGKNLPLIAGNDSHGDFNRYRAMSVPFVSAKEDFERSFGRARTGIYGANLIEAIKTGQTFITDGPFIRIDTIKNTATITIKSSKEFGRISKIWLFIGDCKAQKEKLVFVNISEEKYCYSQEISEKLIKNVDYLRAETVCETENGYKTFAATSAVFIYATQIT